MQADFDAIVVGGGPAGSTAAILLAQAGWSVALIEKQSFPRRKVCGECIAATNLPLLHALGIGDRFDAIAGPEIRRVALYAGDTALHAPLPAFEAPHAWGRALGREHLDTLLIARAAEAGATVLQPRSVRRIERDGAMQVCHTAGADHRNIAFAAPVLIVAHGSWEADPSQESRHRPQRDSDLFAFKANYRDARLDPGVLPVLAFPGGYGGIVVGDHARTTLAFCIRRDALRKARAEHPSRKAAHAVLAHVEAHCRGARDAIVGAEPEGTWLGVGPIQPGIRKPYRDDGAFAIGNLAGEAHPILGEGMSMAIQSAWLLCKRLVAHRNELMTGRAGTEVGCDYARVWRSSFTRRIRLAALFAHLAMRPDASRALLPLLRRWPGLLMHGARAGGKVWDVVTADGL
ncbi:MAG TPA: NAD(P)/FAD-dependent oxidoreductase [Xanthomonadaceae bacterium]|jgi:flavin-dependent dehydrogenase|nr:NAD(P)/FAD-dependent oxidoreductase [Xanthomonadaceae bacterium]